MSDILLDVRHLSHCFPLPGRQTLRAVDNVSFQLRRGEILGLVGESGCGKSTVARCVMNVYRPTAGHIYYDGIDTCDAAQFRANRRRLEAERQIIFQDSTSSLDPRMTAAEIIAEPMRIHRVKPPRGSLRAEAAFQLYYVGMEESYLDKCPPEMSGGQRQRVAIARALATDPKVLLCDEATSALDPTTTNSILALLKELNQKLGVTVVIITHQMSVIEEICTRVAILDGGEVAEEGRVEDIFAHPATDAARRLVYPGGVSAKQYPAGTRAVRVSFNGGTVYDPLIASLAIECGVKVNILGADTRNIDGKAFGTMLLLLPDDPNEAAKALSYIRSQPNITAEEVEYHA